VIKKSLQALFLTASNLMSHRRKKSVAYRRFSLYVYLDRISL